MISQVIFLVLVIFYQIETHELGIEEINHQDFMKFLLNPAQKRNLLDEKKEFIISGIEHGNQNLKFSLKPTSPIGPNFSVQIDGKPTKIDIETPLFTGRVKNDPLSIVVLSFPRFNYGDTVPEGMVHWSNGETHSIGASHKKKRFFDGLYLFSLPKTNQTFPISSLCRNDRIFTSNHTRKKRDVQNNGITTWNGKNYVIEVAFETDPALLNIFNSDQQAASTYIRTVVAAVNVMYSRDFMAQLTITNIGFHTTVVATDGASMITYLAPMTSIQYDVAQLLKGGMSGGFGMVGTVCDRNNAYSDVGLAGAYGTNAWNAIHDPYIIGHEIGHNLGSGHTHDTTYYNPYIDNCGNGGDVPPDLGSVMSYCVTRPSVNSSCTSGSYCNLVLSMGEVGKHGYQSERVNQAIRTTLEGKDTCFTSSGSSSASSSASTSGSSSASSSGSSSASSSGSPSTSSSGSPSTSSSGSPSASSSSSSASSSGSPSASSSSSSASSSSSSVSSSGSSSGSSTSGTSILFDQLSAGTLSIFSEWVSDKNVYIDAADDFTVPSGVTWDITQVVTAGLWNPTSAETTNQNFYVIIYPDGGGSPSSTKLCSSPGVIVGDISSSVTLNINCKLSPGVYWIEISADLPSTDYWYWFTASTSNGYPFMFRDVSGLVSVGCTSWSTGSKCVNGINDHDLFFRLIGTSTSS